MNGGEFYPKAISRAHTKNLFVSANTDIHDSATETYRAQGHRRNMTLIFAKENTLEALREAIEARRTLAYSFGTIAGDEQLLKDLFTASVRTSVLHTDAKGRRHTLPMLRNQTRGAENLCLSDFIADRRDGATDYIGAFALTAGIGLQELCDKFRSEGDDYSAIMAKLLADRLTEAFAEVVHSFVRRQMWGYETAEAPTPQQVIAGEYRGRRMAFGYPASPDHSLKREIFDLLAVEQTTRMRLTENWMISPGEALCGLFFSDARYFSVGQIDAEQLRDYAERRGLAVETVEKIIPNNV